MGAKDIVYSTLAQIIDARPGQADPLRRTNGFYALVKECSVAQRSQGGTHDFHCSCKVIDQSVCHNFPDGIECMVFSKHKEKLPTSAGEQPVLGSSTDTWLNTAMADRTLQPGDVIRIHGVYATTYQGKTQLVAQVDKGASCCLFPHSQSDPSTPYWRSSPNMKARADHDQRLENIREFKPLCRQFACTNPSTGNQYERTVSTLEDGKFLDLNCKVVGTSLEEDPKFMWVWDGTDAAPQDYTSSVQIEVETQESEHPVPRPDKIRYGFWIGELKEFPKMGSVIPVMVVTGKIDSEDLEIRKGQWVKLRNIVVHSVCGQWQGFLHAKSHVMSPDPRAVDKLRSWYNHQMEIQIQFESDNMHPNVPAGRCDFPFRFVRQILIEAFNARDQNGGCLRFRCLLRALRHEPLDICEFSSKGRSGELEFYVQLHLEDSTGDLTGILASPEAEKLFGCQPCDLSAQHGSEARESVVRVVKRLLSVKTVIDCEIHVHWLKDMNRPVFAMHNPKFHQ